jgi:hypothetical protein
LDGGRGRGGGCGVDIYIGNKDVTNSKLKPSQVYAHHEKKNKDKGIREPILFQRATQPIPKSTLLDPTFLKPDAYLEAFLSNHKSQLEVEQKISNLNSEQLLVLEKDFIEKLQKTTTTTTEVETVRQNERNEASQNLLNLIKSSIVNKEKKPLSPTSFLMSLSRSEQKKEKEKKQPKTPETKTRNSFLNSIANSQEKPKKKSILDTILPPIITTNNIDTDNERLQRINKMRCFICKEKPTLNLKRNDASIEQNDDNTTSHEQYLHKICDQFGIKVNYVQFIQDSKYKNYYFIQNL